MAERILAIKLADLGDVLTIEPALRLLREHKPTARIDLLAAPGGAGLASRLPVDETIVYEKAAFDQVASVATARGMGGLPSFLSALRGRRYDAVFLFHHLTTRYGAVKHAGVVLATGAGRRCGLDNGRGWFLTNRLPDPGFGVRHEVALWKDVAALGVSPFPFPLVPPRGPSFGGPHLQSRPDDMAAADDALRGAGVPTDEPFMVLHAGSGGFSTARRWPAERWAATIALLAVQGAPRVLLVGGESERPVSMEVRARALTGGVAHDHVLDLVGRTSLSALIGLLARARLFLGNDAGPAHLAAALGARVVVIFGPSSIVSWAPYGARVLETSPYLRQPERLEALAPGERGFALHFHVRCQPCFYRGHELGWPQGCPTRQCLHGVTPEMAAAAARAVLAATVPPSPHAG